jgi:hypothetical protein
LEYIPARSAGGHRNRVQERWSLACTVEEYKYSSVRFYETGKDEWEFLTDYAD